MSQITKLDNPIQHYDWGSHDAIATLQGRPASDRPEAELWVGDHPAAPSRVVSANDGDPTLLTDWIAQRRTDVLGDALAHSPDAGLPFLVKLLAAAQPLSIQVHPNAEQAAAGFAKENAADPALDPAERNYSDANPKREILIALSPFYALAGFRSDDDCRDRVAKSGSRTALRLLEVACADARKPVAASLLFALREASVDDRAALWDEINEIGNSSAAPDDSAHWLARLCECFPGDPLVCAPLLMNVVALAPGESLLVEPGTAHAYLEGFGIEVMTCSDNVIRAGLTSKRVDPKALRDILRPEPSVPDVRSGRPVGDAAKHYLTQAKEFEVRVQQLPNTTARFGRESAAPIIALCLAGRATFGSELELAPAEAALIPASISEFEVHGPAELVWVSTAEGFPELIDGETRR